ncbi:tape measure protein [Phocoenobacter skyensis]|uniref:Tape measure protein n=1 Tax=Phocoenobacter skyensis TaxID=97481 RepID=A0ABT9JIE8_9PAST|nr:tape measure protein [Pasteurella skyensis]MDP8078329.1 tape measure protein [Pasteurella skyensis]MDP8084579.1 tape measure protein [Pasteurella skyensis]
MVVNELVTVLEYRLKNSKDMQFFMTSVKNIKTKIYEVQAAMKRKINAIELKGIIANAQELGKKFGYGVTELEKLRRAAIKAGISVEKLKDSYINAQGRLVDINGKYIKVKGGAKGFNSELVRTNNLLGRARNLIASIVSVYSVVKVSKLMDESASIKGRLAISADEGNADYVRKQVYENSINSGTDFESNIDLFGSVARNKQALGISDQDAVRLADIVGKSVAMTGGKNPGTDAAAIQQFSQSLSAGTLRGDELRSILENSNGLAKAIADSFGISVGELKEMGEKGLLSSKKMVKGLLAQGDKIDKKFSLIPKRFGQGWTNLHTILVEKVGKPLNQMTLWGQKFYDLTVYISDNFQEIATKVGSAGIAGGLMYAAANAKKLMTTLRGMMLPALRAATIFYGLYLIGEDILVWMQGGNSLIGEWIGSFEEVKQSLEEMFSPLSFILDKLDGSAETLTKWGSLAAMLFTIFSILKSPVGLLIKGLWMLGAAIIPLIPMVWGLLAPFTPLIVAAVGLGAAAYLIYSNWSRITQWFSNVWKLLKTDTLAGVLQIASTIIDNFTPLGWFYNAFAKVLSWFGVDVPDSLSDAFKNAFNNIKNIVLSFNPIEWFINIFEKAFNWLQTKIENAISLFGDMVPDFVKDGWEGVKTVNKVMWDGAKELGNNFVDSVTGFVNDLTGGDTKKLTMPIGRIAPPAQFHTKTTKNTTLHNNQVVNITTQDNPQAVKDAVTSSYNRFTGMLQNTVEA